VCPTVVTTSVLYTPIYQLQRGVRKTVFRWFLRDGIVFRPLKITWKRFFQMIVDKLLIFVRLVRICSICSICVYSMNILRPIYLILAYLLSTFYWHIMVWSGCTLIDWLLYGTSAQKGCRSWYPAKCLHTVFSWVYEYVFSLHPNHSSSIYADLRWKCIRWSHIYVKQWYTNTIDNCSTIRNDTRLFVCLFVCQHYLGH